MIGLSGLTRKYRGKDKLESIDHLKLNVVQG